MKTTQKGTGAARSSLACLAEKMLQYYAVSEPPAPVERMLKEPPEGLVGVDASQISFVMEHGLFSHAPRLAMARLLCREMARNGIAEKLGVSLPSICYADVKYFARCLLMPAQWVRVLVDQGLSIEQIGAYLQVPSYAVVTRMVELELQVPGTD